MDKMTYLFDHEGNFNCSNVQDEYITAHHIWLEALVPNDALTTVHFEELGIYITNVIRPDSQYTNKILDTLSSSDEEFKSKVKVPANILELESEKAFIENNDVLFNLIDLVNQDIRNNKEKVGI
jgi:hypothetical protein